MKKKRKEISKSISITITIVFVAILILFTTNVYSTGFNITGMVIGDEFDIDGELSRVSEELKNEFLALPVERQQEIIDEIIEMKEIAGEEYADTVGLTSRMLLTEEEYLSSFTNSEEEYIEIPEHTFMSEKIGFQASATVLPECWDWSGTQGCRYGVSRENSYTRPVKKGYGELSCWAWSTIDALEISGKVYYNIPYQNVDLSERFLASCALPAKCVGNLCHGGKYGLSDGYYQTFVNNDESVYSLYKNGVALAIDYPYSGKVTSCGDAITERVWYRSVKAETAIIDTKNYVNMKRAIYEYGAVITSFLAYSDFRSFTANRVYEPLTNSEYIDASHSVVAVGWGYHNNRLYWILKNHYGTDWGDRGYFKIYADARGPEGWLTIKSFGYAFPRIKSNIAGDVHPRVDKYGDEDYSGDLQLSFNGDFKLLEQMRECTIGEDSGCERVSTNSNCGWVCKEHPNLKITSQQMYKGSYMESGPECRTNYAGISRDDLIEFLEEYLKYPNCMDPIL